MNLDTYLHTLPPVRKHVFFEGEVFQIEKYDDTEFYINDIAIYNLEDDDKNNWSVIDTSEVNYDKKILNLIKLIEYLNLFFKVEFSIFKDKINLFNYRYTMLTFLSEGSIHPLEIFGFMPDQPNFPFTSDKDIISSNLYYFKEFSDRFKHTVRKKDVKSFVDMMKKIYKCNYDCVGLLERDFGHIEHEIGKLCDNICNQESDDYSELFSNQFLSSMQQCYKMLNFLPNKYIKTY